MGKRELTIHMRGPQRVTGGKEKRTRTIPKNGNWLSVDELRRELPKRLKQYGIARTRPIKGGVAILYRKANRQGWNFEAFTLDQ